MMIPHDVRFSALLALVGAVASACGSPSTSDGRRPDSSATEGGAGLDGGNASDVSASDTGSSQPETASSGEAGGQVDATQDTGGVAPDSGPRLGGALHVKAQDLVDDIGNVVQLRGFGLGGWLLLEGYMIDSPSGEVQPTAIKNAIRTKVGKALGDQVLAEYEKNYVTRDDLALVKKWGFNSVRVPFNANDLMPPAAQPSAAPYVYNDAAFASLDNVATWGADLGLYVILDMHAAPGAQSNDNPEDSKLYPPGSQLWAQPSVYWPRTIDLWLKLAKRYASNSWVIGYDLLNEPIMPGTAAPSGAHLGGPWTSDNNQPLRDIYVQITSALRAAGDRKIVFAEAAFWAMNFAGLTPPWDTSMVYSFHWYPPPTNSGIFTNPDSAPGFTAVFDANVPLWLGETGEDTPALAAQMVAFLKTAYKGHPIGWSWWTTKKLGGSNQPWTCPIPPEYAALNSNWAGIAPDVAFTALMKWAQALQSPNCALQTNYVTALGGTP